MKNYKLPQVIVLAFAALFSVAALAAPPTSSSYSTDTQGNYVEDATSTGISQLNMVLCILNSMNIGGSGMVNKGAYIALVDMNKCQGQGSSGSSTGGASGSTSSKNYMTAVINATRSSSTAPMIADVWMSMTQQGQASKVYAKLTATSSPTDVPPFGVFRMDYMEGSSAPQFNGYINATSTGLQQYETDVNHGNGGGNSVVALNMTAGNTTSGSGSMALTGNVNTTFNFNFNPSYFHRNDTVNGEQCFDRTMANADKSVWQYGTYDATAGTRVDLTNPGFQIQATYNGTSYYGFGSYYGVGFQGLNLNSVADASPIPNLTVTDQRPNNTSTYSLNKVSGKLIKWSQHATTLSAMDGIPFNFSGDLTGKTTSGDAAASYITSKSNGWQNWQMQWNNSSANFTVLGVQSCGNNGCALNTFATPATVNSTAFNNIAISGWSDSFGGSIVIPASTGPHAAADAVNYYTQSTVIPGSTTLTLYCLSNCPDATSANNVANATSSTASTISPFSSGTATQWFSGSNTVTYTFNSTGLNNGSTSMAMTNSTYFSNNNQFSNGVQSGRLFDTAFSACAAGANCEPSNPTTYYTWSTGTNQWNQSLWLTKGSTVVTFDPPQIISYTVPSTLTVPSSGAASPWAGKTIQMQFNGFGQLNGIPGHCVSPANNAEVNCTTSNARYVPEFAIADGTTLTMGSSSLIVKYLNEEVRLKSVAVSNCSALTLTSSTPPTASSASGGTTADGTGLFTVSPTTGTDTNTTLYIGAQPTPVSSTPTVIDGVVQ